MTKDRFSLEYLKSLPERERERVLSIFSQKELQILWHDWNFLARDKQIAPEWPWRIWLTIAGRGYGKSRVLTEWIRLKANSMPGSHGALLAPTSADCRDILVEGESGLLSISPPWDMPRYSPTKRKVEWPNGSYALMFSADEPDRLRGPQHFWAAADEIAAYRYPIALDMLQMGLRLGDNPQIAMGTTPRPLKHIKELVAASKQPGSSVHITNGTTFENRDNLAGSFLDYMIKKYQNTRLGEQELYAILLEDAKGALWHSGMFERDGFRVDSAPEGLERIVVAVDPGAKSPTELEEMMTLNDFSETGIIVAGLARNGHVYVMDDYSISGHPTVWATRVKMAYNHYKADRVIAERNNGGDMVESTIRTVAQNVSYSDVVATRGKAVRAEPIASLYEVGRVHHVGVLSELETQMTQWVPSDPKSKSPDRVDALVWALTELVIGQEEEIVMMQGVVRY